jgi:hypothetical protein
MPSSSIPVSSWSSRKSLTVFAVSIILLSFYSYFAFTFPDLPTGPGADFKRAYTSMVLEPERLPSNAEGNPWTLNPLWQNFFMAPFVTTPWPWGYVLFLAFTLGVSALGAYWFGGNPILLLLSAQLFWVLWWGQLEGWAILSLVVGWVGMERQSWWWMFLALAMASFKPQVGFLPVLAMWWWSGNARWKSAFLLAGVFLFTLVAWGPWPIWYLQGLLNSEFVTNHAKTVQSSLGLIALPLLVLTLILPLNRYQRILALAAAGQLVSPYLPFYSMGVLLCFNIPWWIYALSFIAYFPSQLGTTIAWNGMAILPLSILFWLFLPILKNWWQTRQVSATTKFL